MHRKSNRSELTLLLTQTLKIRLLVVVVLLPFLVVVSVSDISACLVSSTPLLPTFYAEVRARLGVSGAVRGMSESCAHTTFYFMCQ